MKSREFFIEELKRGEVFDVVVVGGGITGSGILRRLAMLGLKVLLLEQKDFAWGTSSRSGKLVHGGLRYIKQGQIHLTYHSVREREKLLKTYRRLIFPLRFAIPLESHSLINRAIYKFGLSIYDLFATKKTSSYITSSELIQDFKFINSSLFGAYAFFDAVTDDVHLTLQVLFEALEYGALALNYTKVKKVEKIQDYYEVIFEDEVSGKLLTIPSRSVVFATGAWVDEFNSSLSIRKLKGSHLVFPFEKIPIRYACTLFHPKDRRPLYLIPWKGFVLLGTTDVDYKEDLNNEVKISRWEIEYLLEALDYWFPKAKICSSDAVSTFSGVRGVLNTHEKDPSKETRDYILRAKEGMIFVAGGKLTTFDYISRKVSKKVFSILNKKPKNIDVNKFKFLSNKVESRILMFDRLFWGHIDDGVFSNILKSSFVVHFEDIMIRRSRIGLTNTDGGFSQLIKKRELIISALNWDSDKFNEEIERYKNTLNYYRLDEQIHSFS